MKDQELPFYDKLIRYIFYPVYLGALVEGRLFYLMGYVSLFLLIGTIFSISNSIVYLSSAMNGMSIVSIVTASLLIYPSAKYCIQISSNNDYDFTNIFLQSMIMKLAISSLFILGYDQCNC